MPSLFTRIIAGEIPGQFVFTDTLWVALLDIAPANPGHVLLVPRAEGQHLGDLPPATLAAMGERLTRLIAAVKRATGCPAVNVIVNDGPAAGQAVPHAHIGDGKLTHPHGTKYAEGEMERWAAELRKAWNA
jgi:histidine triad (HIT) family protein